MMYPGPPSGKTLKHWLWLSLFVLGLDQATKWLILSLLRPFEVIALVPHINLTLVFNEGAAFSFLSDAGGWQRWFFALLAMAISVLLTAWLFRLRSGERLLAVSLALLIGGAVGNLIDRVMLGHVVDFIQVYVPFIPLDLFNPWPAFNIADSAISLGVMMLIGASILTDEPPEQAPRHEG